MTKNEILNNAMEISKTCKNNVFSQFGCNLCPYGDWKTQTCIIYQTIKEEFSSSDLDKLRLQGFRLGRKDNKKGTKF